MTDIHIATTLANKRKEKGLTQEALAHYLGVSKASVSKWETGMSYPDISFLPQLASYFDISIDELMGYDPQMDKEDIQKLISRLNDEVVERPFGEILTEWHELVKKYYACYPLLVQLSLFMMNNAHLAGDADKTNDLVREVIELFKRVQEESHDVILSQTALKLEASCYLVLGEPDMVLVLLEDFADEVEMPPELISLAAYQAKGEMDKAKQITQVGLYQNLIVHFNFLVSYLNLVVDDTFAFETTVKRAYAVAEAYDLEHLHPYLQLSLDLSCAVNYSQRGDKEKALDTLEAYAQRLAHGDAALDLHGDAYFNMLDPWLAELDTGARLPRNKVFVRNDLINMASKHPAFASLSDDKRFQAILAKLERLKDQE